MSGALGDDSNARPATYKAAALPTELRGREESTSAVPKREHPVGCGVSLHVAWPRAAHIPYRQHHVARPRSERTHPKWSGRRVSNSWPRPWRGRALPAELHPQRCKTNHRPVPRSTCGKLLKSGHRGRWCDPSIAGLCRCAGRLRSKNEKGPDPFGIRASANRAWRWRVYALPSPGCTESSFRSSCQWLVGKAWCKAAPHAPSDFIAKARTNATRPFMGRLVLMTCLDFTMKLSEKRGAR